MFGIGMPEMLLLLAIALIVIGPKKLPDLAKSLGRAMREFKKATSEFKETMDLDQDLKEVKGAFEDISDEIKGSLTESSQPDDGGQADDSAREPVGESNKNKTARPEHDGAGSHQIEKNRERPQEAIDVQGEAEMLEPDLPAHTEDKPNGSEGSDKNG